jgi:hypothetical protein
MNSRMAYVVWLKAANRKLPYRLCQTPEPALALARQLGREILTGQRPEWDRVEVWHETPSSDVPNEPERMLVIMKGEKKR